MKKIKIENGKLTAIAAGSGLGVTQVIFFKQYADANWGLVPIIGQYIPWPSWGTYSTLMNIITGSIGVTIGLFSKDNLIRYAGISYGITTLIGGIMNGILSPPVMGARARGRGLALRRPVGRMQPRPLEGQQRTYADPTARVLS